MIRTLGGYRSGNGGIENKESQDGIVDDSTFCSIQLS
jgi:hypothetical protein